MAGVDLIGRDIVGQGSTDVQFCANLGIFLVMIEQSAIRGMSLSDLCPTYGSIRGFLVCWVCLPWSNARTWGGMLHVRLVVRMSDSPGAVIALELDHAMAGLW